MVNELIKVNYDTERPTVLGRDLHSLLEVETRYNDWFKRMCEYGFVEDIDFYSFLSKTQEQSDYIICFPNLESENQGGQNKKDHQISLE